MHPLKKLGLLFVLLALLAGAIPAQGESVTGYAAENTVNLYGKNSASASVVATVSDGESLTCLAAKDGWVLVEYSDEEDAYCRASDLTKKGPQRLFPDGLRSGGRGGLRPARKGRQKVLP